MQTRIESFNTVLVRFLPHLVILAGSGLVLLSAIIDFVGIGGDPGYGRSQIKLAIIGASLALAGILVLPWVRERFLLRWIIPPAIYQNPARSLFIYFGQILLIAVWFGVVMGISDLVYMADQKFANQEEIRFGVDLAWMAPLMGVLITAAVGVILGVVSTKLPRLASFRIVFGVFTFLGFHLSDQHAS